MGVKCPKTLSFCWHAERHSVNFPLIVVFVCARASHEAKSNPLASAGGTPTRDQEKPRRSRAPQASTRNHAVFLPD